ncbi:MAG: shikimate dehydrogenase, partial [Muribaculaceae bacterium]|nr:shikimate dehydrogenase [Muribaculaceae bacterium]
VRLIGHNTDVIGFRESIRPLLTSNHTKAMILGTGGASKAVEHALRSLEIKVQFVSRSHDKSSMTYSDLTDDIIFGHKVIVNTTPLGMYPNTMAMPDIIYYALTEEHLCYDLVYNPEKTMFLMACEAHGAQIKNGIEMLILQAEESWKIWNTNLD